MNNLLPIPIKSINNEEYECICKYCTSPKKYKINKVSFE